MKFKLTDWNPVIYGVRNRPRPADLGIKEMDTFEKKLNPPLSGMKNSQNWMQKHGHVYMTRLKNQATIRKESKLYKQVTLKFRLRH